MGVTLLRLPAVLIKRGCKRAHLYALMKVGLFPPPVKDGRASSWPSNEVDATNAAIIAGLPEDRVRQLVVQLVASRKELAEQYSPRAHTAPSDARPAA